MSVRLFGAGCSLMFRTGVRALNFGLLILILLRFWCRSGSLLLSVPGWRWVALSRRRLGNSHSCGLWLMVLEGSEAPRLFTPPLRRLTRKTSLGFAADDFASEVLGIDLLPWQRWLMIHALELLEDGSPRFRTVLLLVARQNGKSTLLQVLTLFSMYVLRRQLVIGTAQNLDISEEVWQGAVDLAEGVPELASEIFSVDRMNGKKALVLAGGQRYKVQAANRRGGRGLAADLVLLDELREHQKWDAWSAVAKTTLARRNAQVWAASNAGDAASVVLSHLRMMAHARLGDPDRLLLGQVDETTDSSSLGLFEWSAVPGVDRHDPAGWVAANPALGRTISERAIADAVSTDPEPVFRTEVLCQWVDRRPDQPDDLNPSTWAICEDRAARPEGRIVFGVDASPFAASASIVACGGEERPVVELVDNRRGTAWLIPRLRELADRYDAQLVMDPSGPVGALVPDFEAEGLPMVQLDGKEAVRAVTAFVAAVAGNIVQHMGQPELAQAVAGSVRRASGDGQRWSRTNSSTDISPLVAATYAHWAWVVDSEAAIEPNLYFV